MLFSARDPVFAESLDASSFPFILATFSVFATFVSLCCSNAILTHHPSGASVSLSSFFLNMNIDIYHVHCLEFLHNFSHYYFLPLPPVPLHGPAYPFFSVSDGIHDVVAMSK
jgi:hypothetical protein